MSSQLQAQEAEAQARDHDMQCVRDEGGEDGSPLDDAAFFARMASRKLDAAPGEEAGDPTEAARTLRAAISYLKSSLRTAEKELARIEFAHGLEDAASRQWTDIADGVSTNQVTQSKEAA
jgi:hypothetical protein